MKKRLLSIITMLCILMSMMSLPVLAAGENTDLTALHLPDNSKSYSAFNNVTGLVYALDDSTNTRQAFDYAVPSDGLTVLIFFRSQSCPNSEQLIDEISGTQWAQNNLVNIVAVEATNDSKSNVQSYIEKHDTNGVIDKVYYGGSSTGCWYAKLVSRNGDMNGVTSVTDTVPSAAYILLITEEAGTKYIEFSVQGVDTAAYLTRYINEIIETSDPYFVDQIVEVTVPGAERYDYAKEVFEKVNAERATTSVGTLTYSDQLTKLAMQRAAELAVYYDHTRPNRDSPFGVNGDTIKGTVVTYDGLVSENIAMGQETPAAVMNAWMSSTMGHREQILNGMHTQVGVGCYENNGVLYWVQLFGKGNDTATPSETGSVPSDVVVKTSTARLNLSLSSTSNITMDGAQTVTAPALINTNKGNDSFKAVLLPVISEIKDASSTTIATATYGDTGSGTVRFTATSIGTADVIFAAYEGQTDAPSVKLTVNGQALTSSMFTVDTSTETYDGTPKTKTITSSLTADKDYSVTYSGNTNAGTATIIITGKGLYSGTLTYNFTINQANRSLTATLNPSQLYVSGPIGTIALTDNAKTDSPNYTYASSNTAVVTASDGKVTPVGVGEATITINAPATDNYKAGTTTVDVTVTTLPTQDINFTTDSVKKTYGDPAFTNAVINRTVDGGQVTYTSSNANVATVSASGEVTIVGAGEAAITATAASVDGKYAETSASYTLTVEPKTISITGATVADKVYDGTIDASVASVTFDGVVTSDALTIGTDYTADAIFSDANAGADKDVTVKVALNSVNYSLSSGTFKTTATISKATFPAISSNTTLRIEAGRTRELDLSKLAGWPDGLDGAKLTAEVEGGAGLTASISETTLTLTSEGAKAAGDTDTVTVTVSDAVNYENGAISIIVTYTEKEDVAIDGITVSDKVYDGKAAFYTGDITITNKSTGDIVTLNADAIKYIWRNQKDGSVLESAPVNAGEYHLTIMVDDDNYEGELTVSFTISKAALVIRPADITIYVGNALPEEFSLTYNGFVNGETLSVLEMSDVAPNFTLKNGEERLDNSKTAGSYKIEWTNKENVIIESDNYQIQKEDGTLYIRTKSSSGSSGDPSYQIIVSTTSNGTVTATPTSAKSGTKVTITATPNNGYTIGSVTVTDRNGKRVPAMGNGDGTYTFTMPASQVTVSVTFVIDTSWTNPFTDVSEDNWFYDGVAYVAQNGLMVGTSDSTFAPNATTTRAMIVTILYRMEGSPAAGSISFDDVETGTWYTEAVTWAAANGIVDGYGNGKFGPNDPITREQMAVILYRYADYKGYDVRGLADLANCTDAETIGNWALTAIRWANDEGLITGRTTTTLVPHGTATRAEVAAILMRFCQNVAGLE